MYLRGGYVCRVDMFGTERCQRESSYYYDNGPEYNDFVAGSIYANTANNINMHRTRSQYYTSSTFIMYSFDAIAFLVMAIIWIKR